MTDQLIERELARQSHLSTSKRQFLHSVIERFEGLAELQGDSPEAQATRGEGCFRIGKMRRLVGEPRKAVETLREAIAFYRDHTLSMLHQARERGLRDRALLDTASDLAPLRGEPSFERFGESLAAEARQ